MAWSAAARAAAAVARKTRSSSISRAKQFDINTKSFIKKERKKLFSQFRRDRRIEVKISAFNLSKKR